MSFMTFYTPTYKRPTYLAICKRSVQMQTCQDFQHMVIVDEVGIGVAGMFEDIHRHTDAIRGKYVFILGDDDCLLEPDGLARVKAFAEENNHPPVIIVRNHKWDKTFPLLWECAPEYLKIDLGNFIIRADVFIENAERFGKCYEGDFVFIDYLWKAGYPFAWLDYVFSGMQIGGKGRTEAEIVRDMNPILVRAIKSFAAIVNGRKLNVRRGQELIMLPGVDWIYAGLVVPVDPAETATMKPTEKAVIR